MNSFQFYKNDLFQPPAPGHQLAAVISPAEFQQSTQLSNFSLGTIFFPQQAKSLLKLNSSLKRNS